MKKTLAAILMMGMPAAMLAMQPLQNATQETGPATASSNTARSHHSSRHHKRSKGAHHRSHQHHTAKQHTPSQ